MPLTSTVWTPPVWIVSIADARVGGDRRDVAVEVGARQQEALLGQEDQVLLAVDEPQIVDPRVEIADVLHRLAAERDVLVEVHAERAVGHEIGEDAVGAAELAEVSMPEPFRRSLV